MPPRPPVSGVRNIHPHEPLPRQRPSDPYGQDRSGRPDTRVGQDVPSNSHKTAESPSYADPSRTERLDARPRQLRDQAVDAARMADSWEALAHQALMHNGSAPQARLRLEKCLLRPNLLPSSSRPSQAMASHATARHSSSRTASTSTHGHAIGSAGGASSSRKPSSISPTAGTRSIGTSTVSSSSIARGQGNPDDQDSDTYESDYGTSWAEFQDRAQQAAQQRAEQLKALQRRQQQEEAQAQARRRDDLLLDFGLNASVRGNSLSQPAGDLSQSLSQDQSQSVDASIGSPGPSRSKTRNRPSTTAMRSPPAMRPTSASPINRSAGRTRRSPRRSRTKPRIISDDEEE